MARKGIKQVTNGDAALFFQEVGEGEPVVLIHGLGANLAFWYMGIARALARDYRVICYDLRGHGRSNITPTGYDLPAMTSDLAALLAHLNIDSAHVVGHSHGARVALHFTLNHPHRVQSLTVADTQLSCVQPRVRLADWPYWPTWKQQLHRQGHVTLPPDDEFISYRLLHYFNKLSGDFTHGGLTRAARGPTLRRRDMGARGTRRWERLLETTTAERDFDDDKPITIRGLRSLTVPTLATFGEYSHCLPSSDRIARLVPGCKTDVVPEVGHFHPAIKPRRFVRVLRQFLLNHSEQTERMQQRAWRVRARMAGGRDPSDEVS